MYNDSTVTVFTSGYDLQDKYLCVILGACLINGGTESPELEILGRIYYNDFSFIYGAGVQPSPLKLWQFIGLLYQSWMVDSDECGAIGGINEWQWKPMYTEETCPCALTITDPT
jgi:hypothetical protein